jgi:hypothetical protein
MAGNLKKLAMCAVVAFGSGAMAQDEAPAHEPVKVPSAEEAKTTVEYYLKGQGQGPILLDAMLCGEVAKDGPDKNECITPLPPDGVKANSKVSLWQAYLVPQGDTVEDVRVQVKQGDIVRETKDMKLVGSPRTRQWTNLRLNKPGNWNISILRGDQVLKSIDVKVQ